MNLTRRGIIGAAIAVGYVLVAAVTMHLTARHVRPLYEGFAPPPPYQWVNPPPEFRAGNTKPKPSSGGVPLTPAGSTAGAVNTDDGQLSLNLPTGAFPAHPGDDSVVLHMTPLDPATLANIGSDLAPDGNAYRVEATYTPSDTPITAPFAKAGDVFLVVPEPASALLFSGDGKAWQRLSSQPTGDTTAIAASFDRAGYYLAAMTPTSQTPGKSSETGRVVLIAGLTATLALVLIRGAAAWRRARRPAPARGGRARATRKSNGGGGRR